MNNNKLDGLIYYRLIKMIIALIFLHQNYNEIHDKIKILNKEDIKINAKQHILYSVFI